MALFFTYLKSQRKKLYLALLFGMIYVASFLLYHLPVLAAVYPAAVCALLGLIVLFVDFSHQKSRHAEFVIGKDTPTLFPFPEPENICETDYREIAELLQNEVARLETEWKSKYTDMTDYYTVWAHQIKTPIASMRLALQKEDSAEARKLLYELRRIEQYVEMVLVFIRLDSNSSDYVLKAQPVDPLIKQAIRRFAPDFIGKKLKMSYESSELCAVTDEKWLVFVLEQLLSNALKYTRTGGIRVYFPEPKVLCIEDSGIGIAPEDLPRIFEKGYTGGNGRVDRQASGLGLYLCRQICTRLHIGLSAQSQVDVGTKVFLDFAQYELKKE